MKQKDQIDITGHLQIIKVYPDGKEEVAFDDHNVITSGMGAGLGLLYAGSGAADITNFQVRYFQLGVSGDSVIDSYGPEQVALVSALGQVNGDSDYRSTSQSTIPVFSHELSDSDGTAKSDSEGETDEWRYAFISDNAIKRVDLNSVTYILYVDQNSCNDHTLNEVGLFMKNPQGLSTNRSTLVAYRPFTNIEKTSDFSLVFKWTLNF
jgi:hypothetical protein